MAIRAVLLATMVGFVSTLGWSLASTAAQPSAVNLTGTWNGTASDFFVGTNTTDGMTVNWVLTQTGTTVSGTVTTTGLNPGDGSCSSCHRAKSGTVSGSVSGSSLSVTMDFPGGNGEITASCTATFSGTAATIADTFTTLYSGTDSCEGVFQNGTLTMTRSPETLPSITSQPAGRLVPTGQPVTLGVTGAGTAPLSYQWYRGTSGNTSSTIVGAELAAYTTPPVSVASDYWVRVANAYGSTIDSDTARLTPYSPFTDDVLTVGASVVRAVHINELRNRIDVVRARFGLGAYLYADATLVVGATTLRAQHIIELRAALQGAYVAAGRPPPGYFDASLVPGDVVKAVHLAELRTALALIE